MIFCKKTLVLQFYVAKTTKNTLKTDI